MRETGVSSEQPRHRDRAPWWAWVCLATVAIAASCGFVHVVYVGPMEGETHIEFCRKEGWSLADTFVDLRYFDTRSVLSAVADGKAPIFRALEACGQLERRRR